MQPRPYQESSIDATLKGFNEFNKQLLVLPTGGGKTLVFSWLAKSFLPKRTLILAHREELIDQAIQKLHAATGIFAGKEKAEFSASQNDQVVVASVQTMIRRLDRWKPDHFGLVVADECHHSISESWGTVLDHFSGAKILGVTATPDRGDKRELGGYYENIAAEVGLFDLINQQFLCPITIKSVPLKINLNAVKQTAGDFDSNGLDGAIRPYLDEIAESIKTHAAGRKTLAFLPLIATSQAFKEVCIRHGLRAEHIDGVDDERKEKLAAFHRGDYDVLSNAMLLTEGYDEPSINCIVNLRPTRSRPLYSQIAGRGTRLCEGKKDLLLLDFLFQHERLNIVRPAHLIAKNEEEAQEITKLAMEKQDSMDLQEAASDARSTREEKLRKELEAKSKRKAKTIDPASFLLSIHRSDLAEYEPEMRWESEPVTTKQAELLTKFGFDVTVVKGKGHASKLIGALFQRRERNLATPKQMKWLERFKHPAPDSATFAEASAYLDLRMGGMN